MIGSIAAPAQRTPISSVKSVAPDAAGTSEALPRIEEDSGLTGAVLVTTACIHLLLVAITGLGIHSDPVHLRKPEPPPTRLIEDVKLEQPPPPPKDDIPVPDVVANPSAPAVAANIDLPPLPATAEISAVPADVPVAFAIAVTGPVKLVKDASRASGAVGGRPNANTPVSVDSGEEHARFLLLPPLTYPPTALERRISGSVEIEFKTNPTGEIYDIKIRNSSGYADLDRAAIQNMRRGRWTGEPGYFVKKFVFVLN